MTEAETENRIAGPWRILFDAPIWLAAFALFLLMVMTFADVILRSAANNPIESATELTRLLMAIIVFSALPLVSWKGDHIIGFLDDHPALVGRRLRGFKILGTMESLSEL